MRSIGLLAAVTGTLWLASACSDGGGTPPPENAAPVANFGLPSCSLNVACPFSSTSTDDAAVTAWSWDFDGDGTPDAGTADASFTYLAAGKYEVSLTVGDAEGLQNTRTRSITIAPEDPGNSPPTAAFTHTCDAATCSFTSTSSDAAPGSVAAYQWEFGDGATAGIPNPSHTYDVTDPAEFTVKLTVTDDEGATGVATRTVNVAPAVPANVPPTAGFTFTCEHASCSFTSTATDAPPGSIAGYAWDFGDGATADVASPSHSYAVTAPTDFSVTLTVTDDEGATAAATQVVSVAPAPPPNTPPTASFTVACTDATCRFTSTSTDAPPGTVVAHAWTFGDGATAAVPNPTHTYAVTASASFTVTLTVTDDQGAGAVATRTITVSPPPPGAERCVTGAARVDCFLDVLARSKIRLRLLGVSCDLRKQRITVPQGDQVFLGVCSRAVGDSTMIFGGPMDSAVIFEPGSQVWLRFSQGIPDDGDPPLPPPAARLEGSFPNWTIHFEDGDNAGSPGEPDFADVVLGVEAIPVP